MGEVELHERHEPVAALVGHLVVEQLLEHRLTGSIGDDAVGRPVVVPIDGEEHLVVMVDEPVPQPLPEAGGQRGAVGGDVDDLVGGDDRRHRRVGVQHRLGPVEVCTVGAPRHVDGHHRYAGDGELVPVRHPARPHLAEARGVGLTILGEPRAVVVEVVGNVVVARDHRVGRLGVVQDFHGTIGHDVLVLVPLAGLVADVTQVVGHGDVVVRGVIDDPLRLTVVGVGQARVLLGEQVG